MNDLRFAFRQLARTPGFTAVVILSLAIGIGANTTVLCWLQNLVLEPLAGVPRQEQLVALVSNQGGGCASLPDLADYVGTREVFSGAEASMPTSACLTLDKQPEWIQAQVVTANFFSLLQVSPIHGRTFRPDEDKVPGGNPVVVISERLWRRRFASAPSVVGREIDINRTFFTIIGIVPDSFAGSLPPSSFDVWAPASMIWEIRNQNAGYLTRRNARGWHNLARLQPGVTLEQAQAAVATINARLAAAYPNESRNCIYRVEPLSRIPWGGQTVLGPTLWLLLAVSIGVQLIVTANVANLLLARTVGRSREIAIRLSAGASQYRLIRQFLVEGALLSIIGAAFGVLLSRWSVDAIQWMLPADLRHLLGVSFAFDFRTLGLTILVTLATGVILGLAPAWHTRRTDLAGALKDSSRGATGGALHHRLRSTLVAAEIAVASLLLIVAGLCIRGLQRARAVDVGFTPGGVLIGGLQIGMNGYNRENGPQFYRRLREHLAAHPQVEDAALATWFPLGLSGCKGLDATPEGYQPAPGENLTYEYAILSPHYFSTMQIPLVAGRDFTDADDTSAPRVAIVNEHFANRFWPGLDPIGRKFRSGGVWRTVVGVAKAGKYNRIDEAPHPFFYLPYLQGVPDLDLGVCVRTKGDPAAFAASLRQSVKELDPGVELLRTVPLKVHSGMALMPQSLAVHLLMFLGGAALLLAAMGVYAVLAYTVSQRTREFGIRMALGARPVDVMLLVLRQTLLLCAAGAFAGLLLAAILTHRISGFLYSVNPFSPAIFAGVPLLIAAIAMLASWLPARRATRVDPVIALRSE